MANLLQIQENQQRVGYQHRMEDRMIDKNKVGINRLFLEAEIGEPIQCETTSEVVIQVIPEQTLDDEFRQFDGFKANTSSTPFSPTSTFEYKTVDKGYSIIPEISYDKPDALKFDTAQLGLRNLTDMNSYFGQNVGGYALPQLLGIPQREYRMLTENYTEKYIALEMIKALSRSYQLARPIKAKDGSMMTNLSIANKLNSNSDRSSGMTFDKILSVKNYMVTVLGHSDENLMWIFSWSDIRDLWEDMAPRFGFSAGTGYNAFNNYPNMKINPMQKVALPTKQMEDVKSIIGGDIVLLHPLLYNRAISYLQYFDGAQNSNTDDVTGYTAQNLLITKSYCIAKSASNLSNLFKIYPTVWTSYMQGNPPQGTTYYLEQELLKGIFFFKRWTNGTDISGTLGPTHYCGLFGRFYIVREDNRNIIEIHSKYSDPIVNKVNTNISRTTSVDQFLIDV